MQYLIPCFYTVFYVVYWTEKCPTGKRSGRGNVLRGNGYGEMADGEVSYTLSRDVGIGIP